MPFLSRWSSAFWKGCFLALLGIALSGAISACGTTAPNYSGTNCPALGVSDSNTCTSCLQEECPSAVSSTNQQCAFATLSCACRVGRDPATCAITPVCTSVTTLLSTCANGVCANACNGATAGGGDGGGNVGGGGGGNVGGGGGGNLGGGGGGNLGGGGGGNLGGGGGGNLGGGGGGGYT